MALTHARSAPAGSGSFAKSPATSRTRSRRPAAASRRSAMGMTGGRSNNTAVAAGQARRNAMVHVPDAPPTSSTWVNSGGTTARITVSANGAEVLSIAPMKAAWSPVSPRRLGLRSAGRPVFTTRASWSHRWRQLVWCCAIASTLCPPPGCERGRDPGCQRITVRSFFQKLQCGERVEQHGETAQIAVQPVRHCIGGKRTVARGRKRSSSAAAARTQEPW